MEDILDANIKVKRTKWTDLIPTVLVLVLFVWKVSKYLTNDYYFEPESALAFLAVGIATVLYFVNKNIYIYGLLIIFIAGLIGMINFTPAKHMFHLLFVRFDPFFLLLIACHLTIFYGSFELKAAQTKKELHSREVESFKDKLKDKTKRELEEIIANQGLRHEVKLAAKALLETKQDEMS